MTLSLSASPPQPSVQYFSTEITGTSKWAQDAAKDEPPPLVVLDGSDVVLAPVVTCWEVGGVVSEDVTGRCVVNVDVTSDEAELEDEDVTEVVVGGAWVLLMLLPVGFSWGWVEEGWVVELWVRVRWVELRWVEVGWVEVRFVSWLIPVEFVLMLNAVEFVLFWPCRRKQQSLRKIIQTSKGQYPDVFIFVKFQQNKAGKNLLVDKWKLGKLLF